MASSTRSRRTRQTQLGFATLSSSSPAAKGQPEAVRDRAAAITITDSPSPAKKRRTMRDYLPTPSASSQTHAELAKDDPASSRRSTRGFMASQTSSRVSVAIPKVVISDRPELNLFDDSESDTPAMQSSPMRKTRYSTASKNHRHSPVEVLSSSEDDMPRSSARRKPVTFSASDEAGSRSPASNPPDGSDDDQDQDQDVIPSRRNRRPRRPSPTVPDKSSNAQDQADLDEDLDFLGEADTESPRALRRAASATAKTAKQLALEALKKKRLNRTNESGNPPRFANSEDDNPSETDLSLDGDLDPDIAEQGESDFIVEDDGDETLGGPVDLPFQFSRYRTMKPKELFKFVVEWMVQKKINPAFEMHDEVYQIAFDRLDDFVRGMGGSKFHSSAWTPLFSKMLKTRPLLEDHQFVNESFLRDRCDACNRSGHPATWEVKFTGATYDRNTLEEDSDDESGADDDDDEAEQNTVFYIGKFCMRNARTAHKLTHWKYHLKEWVVDHLKDKGELKSKKIVERDGWSTSKRRKDAERIVDEMERAGEIRALHQDFKREISDAHYTEHSSGRDMSSP